MPKAILTYDQSNSQKWIALTTLIGFPASVALFQTDIIPTSVWEQLPVVMIFSVAIVFLARLHFQDQEKWREILRDERQKHQESMERILADQRKSQVELITMLQAAEKDTFDTLSRAQMAAFEEAIERITSEVYKWSGKPK